MLIELVEMIERGNGDLNNSKLNCIVTLATTTTICNPKLSVKTFSSNGNNTFSSSLLPDLLLSSPASSGSVYSWNCRTTTAKKIFSLGQMSINIDDNKLIHESLNRHSCLTASSQDCIPISSRALSSTFNMID